ncbi:MAG: MOSC N-terminal beta barrel domain-containing protein [Opitutaceae bacterium]|jgi:hypothetical protein
MQLAGIYIYPVKGCRGLSLTSASLDALGIVGDRRFLIVDQDGKFITQRTHPQMALITASLDERFLALSHPGQGPLAIPRASDPSARLLGVEVWKSHGLQAEDCGDEASEWVRTALGTAARLARIGNAFHRPVKPGRAQPGDVVSFADAYPFLLIGKASLGDLNDRLLGQREEPVPMDRFRPNLVIAGAPAFAEDTLTRFRIGDVIFRTAGPCARCIVTTTDQLTGERLGPEPLRTLAAYRRNPTDHNEVIFGQNLLHETKAGLLLIGAPVEFCTT